MIQGYVRISKIEHSSIEFCKTRTKAITTAMQSEQGNITINSHWELEVQTSKPPEERGNANDQVVVGFSFVSDWFRKWREVFGPITLRGKTKAIADYPRHSTLNCSVLFEIICQSASQICYAGMLLFQLGLEYEKIGVKFYLAHCRCKLMLRIMIVHRT